MAWFDTNKGYKTYGGNGYPEHGHRPVILGSDGSSQYHRATSPPPRVHYSNPHDYGKSKNSSDDENDYSSDDDIVCEDGVCYKKNGLKNQVYDKEKHKGYGKELLQYGAVHQPQYNGLPQKDYSHQEKAYYAPPSYPKQDPYYEKTYPNNHNDKHKGNDYSAPATYDTYNKKAHPRPIKTRVDTNQAIGFMPDSPKNSPGYGAVYQPQYNGLPRKDHNRQEPRRYGVYDEQQYYNGKTIDCLEAAKKYHGVLVAK